MHVFVRSMIWQESRLGEAFARQTNKTNGLETLEKGKNDTSVTLVKCMITGYEDASGIAPARKLVLRN